jgi:hypothetical protein
MNFFRIAFAYLVLLPSTAATAMAQERQWSFDQTDKDAYLVFGVPETDDVGLSFWCTQRSGKIKIFVPESSIGAKSGKEMQLRLDVANKTFRLKAAMEASSEGGAANLETELPVDHPIFTAIAEADRITVRVAKRRDVFPLQDVDLSALLQVCKAS